ncbi:hypothetical protein XthCFBP4691_17890 [Xanthomonas theicola]|uniref:Uncharacterized protein n=1 Tax=Xanthomonas theicola TaxID=56464 RepID=A0A2S6ZAY8_9XANT|nr:hypothetical protein XthCFBP4691_17890 [Xanthomonas theicola]
MPPATSENTLNWSLIIAPPARVPRRGAALRPAPAIEALPDCALGRSRADPTCMPRSAALRGRRKHGHAGAI